MSRVVPGWPWWKRINFIIFTVGGGAVGFYLENKMERKHKARLQQEVPQLEQDLAAAVSKRQSLETQLQQLTGTLPAH